MRARALSLLALAAACAGCGRPITLLTYNTFNTFDASRDGGEYRQYDPAAGKWSAALFERKLAAIATVIRRSCAGGPDIVALQELENPAVLEALCSRHLGGYRYHVAPAGGDAGVRCGVASRLPIRRVATYDPGEWAGSKLRPLLEVEIDCRGVPLIVLVVHWKSKIDGEAGTQAARHAAAAMVARRLAELRARRPGLDVIVAGDFNQNLAELGVGSDPRARLTVVDLPGLAEVGPRSASLYDPWFEVAAAERGSAVYAGAWQTPDHLLLSPQLFDGSGLSYRRGSFRVVHHSFMLDRRTGFPLRDRELTWRYSDHLPLLVELEPAAAAPPVTPPVR